MPINKHLANTGGRSFEGEDVTVIFDRDVLINETEAINNCKNSVGILSDETIVKMHPWVTDPEQELQRIKDEKEEAMQADPYYEVDVPAGEEYTSYVLGEGSINFEDLGAKVPYEMSRDPAKNGGQDTLYTRQRKVFAPKGISYEKTSQTTLSPTDAELSDGANWALVHSGEATESQRSYINHKVIPIARIKSRG